MAYRVPEWLGYLFEAICSIAAGPTLPGPALPPGKGETMKSGPWQAGCWACTHCQTGCFQGTASGSGGVWPPLNVLPWLSMLRGVASGSWERASGSGPWDSWLPGGGLSQAPLAVPRTAVHTQNRLCQHRGPAGPSSEPSHVMETGLSSGLVAKRPEC